MPMPVSTISNLKPSPCLGGCISFTSVETLIVTVPSEVNFRALPVKFIIICRRRLGSPMTTKGTSCCISSVRVTFLPCTLTAIASLIPYINVLTGTSNISSSILLASILAKSKISSRISRRPLADVLAISTILLMVSGGFSSPTNSKSP